MPTSDRRLARGPIHRLGLNAIGGLLLAVSCGIGESVASGGPRYDALGDSITRGQSIAFDVDKTGKPRRSHHEYQGWPELLARMLSTDSGANAVIANLGLPGSKLGKIKARHAWTLFAHNPRPANALLLIGTNDTHPAEETPSGLGCSGLACDGSYAGLLNQLLRNLLSNGRETVTVALLPPIWGNSKEALYTDPLGTGARRNALISEYNRVIAESARRRSGVLIGPDFFSCFLTPDTNRFSLFTDALHPNTLGYVLMAALWRDAIHRGATELPKGPCVPPVYLLESLDPYKHGHKQDLLVAGDRYYTDETHTLVNVPDELADGIWVLQANADRHNEDEDFLEFDAGISPVTVYIAYDPSGDAPVSAAHTFATTTLSSGLTVTDPAVNRLEIVSASGVTGHVRIGGNRSAGGPGEQQGYVVIVVP